MVRTEQGGSVLSFVIISVILAILFIGGIFAIQQQQRATPTPEVTSPPSESKPTETPAPEKDKTPQETQPPVTSQPTPTHLPSDGGPAASQLPQTGPSETIISAIAVALLSGLAVSYIRSRRSLSSL